MDEDPVAEMQRKVQDVQRLAAEVESEAVSEDGAVRVVAGAAGNIRELDLRMTAFQLSGVELGELIVETIRTADQRVQTELSDQVTRIMGSPPDADVLGGGMPRIDRETET